MKTNTNNLCEIVCFIYGLDLSVFYRSAVMDSSASYINYFVIMCKKKCNPVQKFVISCNYNLKATNPIKMQKFLWERLRHELSVHAWIVTLSLSSFVFHRHFFTILILFKTHPCKLIPYWTSKGSTTYSNNISVNHNSH